MLTKIGRLDSFAYPLFPDFKRVYLKDKHTIEKFTSQFIPISDFNFFSLWTYNTQNDLTYSILNSNLVLCMRDYLNDEPSLTFLGKRMVPNTVGTLLTYTEMKKYRPQLALLYEGIIKPHRSRLERVYDIFEDDANHDYLLSISELTTLSGERFHNKRNMINRFFSENKKIGIRMLNFNKKKDRDGVLDVFNRWAEGKHKAIEEIKRERIPIERMLRSYRSFNLSVIGLLSEGKLLGFAVAEKIDSNYAIFHFVKAVPGYKGAFDVLYTLIAKELRAQGCSYLNIEQDFSMDGLRHAKQQWNPVGMIKKYLITTKTNN